MIIKQKCVTILYYTSPGCSTNKTDKLRKRNIALLCYKKNYIKKGIILYNVINNPSDLNFLL